MILLGSGAVEFWVADATVGAEDVEDVEDADEGVKVVVLFVSSSSVDGVCVACCCALAVELLSDASLLLFVW